MGNIYGLILAGGSGVRLWPRSREELPKQFLSLRKGNTMLQETVTRMLRIMPPERLYAVTGGRWSALVAWQAREVAILPDGFVIEEPVPRNTAAAIMLGVLALRRAGVKDNDVVVVAPSDHVVRDAEAFDRALREAAEAAAAGYMVTLGVPPLRPDVGFGYLKQGAPAGRGFKVEAFIEKPQRAKAEEYLRDGGYFWNSGIFIFTPAVFDRELEQTAPELFAASRRGYDGLLEVFQDLPSVSFDYAVMEKAQRVAMVEMDAGWSDVGSWDALYDVLEKDGQRNVLIGDIVLQNVKNCLVDSRSRLTAMIDVEDLIVIDSSDALFIAPRGSSQKVRDIVDHLKNGVRREAVQASENARPWGVYRILCEEERFKIKRIIIMPGKRLSMQYHHHRSEHWVVVRGTAHVTIDGKEQYIHEGESVFIPKNVPHRLENPGKVELEIVEIQGGEYLGEDDIVRLSDDFNRKT